MPINNLTLRKVLKLAFSNAGARRADLRGLIRSDLAREAGTQVSGGDFYGPFWSDAKLHVLGQSDLHADTEARVEANIGRRNLYPQLRDGFLLWWNDRRRWTNAPYQEGHNRIGQVRFPQLDASIRVENLMTVVDGHNDEYAVYPYFFPDPVMSDEMARLGLWALTNALADVPPAQVRMLDVLRGRAFSLDRTPLQGDEGELLVRHLEAIMREHDVLREEYE